MALEKRKYIKKVIVTDEHSIPEARAERLRRVRNMANLTRQEICTSDDLNINTYKGWEIARYGGLPVDGAEKIIRRVSFEGVICSTEWLLYGKGQGPYVIPKESSIDEYNANEAFESKDIVLREIMVFQKYYPEAIYIEIHDDGMLPIYENGDLVAGVKKYGDAIDSLLYENCIIQMANGNNIARCITPSEKSNRFTLVCLNPKCQIKTPVIYDAKIKSAALITRHYKVGL